MSAKSFLNHSEAPFRRDITVITIGDRHPIQGPNRPQFGTWKFSRAGWAPGDVVHPWWIDLTPHLVPGATAR